MNFLNVKRRGALWHCRASGQQQANQAGALVIRTLFAHGALEIIPFYL